MSRFGLLGAAALLGVAACQPTETPEQMQARMDQESAAFKQYADGVASRWAAWFEAGQADSIANLFTDNGRQMPPNGPAVVGREAIKAAWQQSFDMGTWSDIHIGNDVALANGSLGVTSGPYSLAFTPKPGMQGMMMPPPADTGKSMLRWQNVNGTWQVAELIWNSNMPLPAPAPARR